MSNDQVSKLEAELRDAKACIAKQQESLRAAARMRLEAEVAPDGFALVPLHPNRAMERVMLEDSWQWGELLAAAGTVTEEDCARAAAPAPIQSAELKAALDALRFYAEGQHFVLHDADVFDTVSGEPQNWQEDESNTIMFEDGSVAKQALDALDAALAAPAAAPARDSSAELGSMAAVVAFLSGESLLEGHAFGERKAGERGEFWWRKPMLAAWRALATSLQQEQAKPTDLTTAQAIEFGATLIGHASETDGMDAAEGTAWVRARLSEWTIERHLATPTKA